METAVADGFGVSVEDSVTVGISGVVVTALVTVGFGTSVSTADAASPDDSESQLVRNKIHSDRDKRFLYMLLDIGFLPNTNDQHS